MGYRLNKTIKLSQLLAELNIEHIIVNDIEIIGVSSFAELSDGFLSFSKNIEADDIAGVVFTSDLNAKEKRGNLTEYVYSENPRLSFILALSYLELNVGFSMYEFDSIIDDSVSIGENVVIEKGCIIEKNVVLEHNVIIHSGTIIRKNSRIRSNSVIGGDGFGFEYLSDRLVRFPHLGGVIIGSDVEIGAMNSIARGTLSNTIVQDGVKTDNLVHIAHNCEIGKNSLITACAEISGGVKVGERVWLGPNCSIIQKVSIGDCAFVGIGAVVTKDVQSKTLVAGNPAKFIKNL